MRKSRKRTSRFVSPTMRKIDEELKKKQNIMRTFRIGNQTSTLQQAKRSSPESSNMVKSNGTTMSKHLGPSDKNAIKLYQSLAMSSKVGNHSKYSPVMSVPLGKLDKATKSRPSHKLNGTLRPLEHSRQPRTTQGLVDIPNSIKRSYSQANHLKAMPGLVQNKKVRSNLHHGVSTGMQNEGGHGGTKDKNLRCKPLPKLKIPGDVMQIEGGVGGTKDKNLRCKPLPKLKIPGDVMQIEGGVGRTKDKNMRRELLPEPEIRGDRMQSEGGLIGTNDRHMRCEPSMEPDIDPNITRKRRKYIETNDEDDENDENDYTRLPSDNVKLKDCHAKVSTSYVSNNVARQCNCCSMPIDEPAWSGILKIDNKDYISLSGHLSTKSGEKVWNSSKSLRKVVEVTKVCRSDVWPKRWEVSGPTNDNIGLYLFSYKMRPDKYLDQLVMEAMENDLALRTTVDDAEMLIFPSSLLPEQYQTFQSKRYLWGVFRPRVVQGKHGDESQHVENPTEEATAAVATHATTSLPAEATAVAPNNTTVPTNGQIDFSMGAPPGRVFSFVVQKTPRVEQLIQEIEREGALIVAMQGEMIAGEGSLVSQRGERNAVSRSST